jgi:hypothetical protein
MSGTGLENGLRRDWYIDERSDPEKATVAAAKYLQTLSKIFGGDWHLALASYNGGPGRMQRALKTARVDNFWTLAEKSKILPRETREYVPMILAAMVIARNPSQYGFDFEPETGPEIDTVTLARPVDQHDRCGGGDGGIAQHHLRRRRTAEVTEILLVVRHVDGLDRHRDPLDRACAPCGTRSLAETAAPGLRNRTRWIGFRGRRRFLHCHFSPGRKPNHAQAKKRVPIPDSLKMKSLNYILLHPLPGGMG